MQSVDHIIHTQWLITCEEQNQILNNHALIIDKGLIKDILPSKLVAEQYHSKSIHDYTAHAVIPGLINAHTHLGMSYLRGVADDLALMNWLNNHIWPAEKKFVRDEFVYDGTLFGIAELIRSGTTCFNEMYFFLGDTARATEQSSIRGHIAIHVINFPTNWAENAQEEISKGIAILEQYKNHPLIGITIAPHAIYTVSDESILQQIKEIAETYDLKINMHINETADEVQQSVKNTGLTPLKRLQKLGYITPRLIAVHMTQIDNEDYAILKEGKPNIVHCPLSNMKLASGTCPVEKLQAIGLNVALGTDGSASNNDLNMISEMRFATLLAKHMDKNPESLPAEKVLQMATLNGAKALGIDHLTGSLTKGKAADLAAINLDELESLPLYHPISQIVYAVSRYQVEHVWVAGKQLMKNRKLTTLDENELKEKAKRWGEKIKNVSH